MSLGGVVEDFLGRRSAAAMPAELVERDPAIITLISIVYSTVPKTFAGPATLITVTAGLPTVPTVTAKTAKTVATPLAISPTTTLLPSVTPTLIPPVESTTSTKPLSTSSIITPTVAAAATASAAPSASASPSSGGMTAGAKAGLAIGLLALFGLVIAGVVALYRRRRYQQDLGQRLDDEKDFLSRGRNPNALPPNPTPMAMASTAPSYNYPPAPVAAAAAAPASVPLKDASPATRSARFSYEEPPQVNVRAMSQFDPGFQPQNDMPAQHPAVAPTAAAAGVAGAAMGAALAANHNQASSPNPSVGANDPNNPFGNHAENIATSPPQSIPLPPSPKPDTQSEAPIAELPANEVSTGSSQPSEAKVAGEVAAAGAGAAVVAGAATAAASANKSQNPSSSSPTPPGDNVHRVQLDFVPSMDDELEVRAGGLVRMLYEYDDGWALCMRMDRSQQGVVPRTCLSKIPVKPRPISPTANRRGPPPQGMRGPGGRPMTPTGRNMPYQTSPQQGRARSNSSSMTGPYQPYTAGARSQSPGPNGGSKLRPQDSTPNLRRRSNSMSGMVPQGNMSTSALPSDGRPSIEIPSKIPTRKPVPSQGSTSSS